MSVKSVKTGKYAGLLVLGAIAAIQLELVMNQLPLLGEVIHTLPEVSLGFGLLLSTAILSKGIKKSRNYTESLEIEHTRALPDLSRL